VKSAYRKAQSVVLTDLDGFLDHEIGMLTTVLIGSSSTVVFEGHMVTPRGYTNKYTLDGTVRPGQHPGRALV
jgi:precorrin-3B C17-methyltransferase